MVKYSDQPNNNLTKANCFRCGSSLDTAKVVQIAEMSLGVISHAVCSVCKAENMLTITNLGTGVLPMESDLISSEVKKFAKKDSVSLDNVLDLHLALEKDSLCSLLQLKEHNLENKQKN